jgi:hypothetical protein
MSDSMRLLIPSLIPRITKPAAIQRPSYSSVLQSTLTTRAHIHTEITSPTGTTTHTSGWTSPGKMALNSLDKLGKVRELMREKQLDA